MQTEGFTFPADVVPANIGKRIAELRQSLGWTQADLAAKAGPSSSTISRIEKGRSPQSETIIRLLRALSSGGADFELKELVPDWPEADLVHVVGYGPLSRLRRQELGLSQKQVASIIGIDAATLSRFECNKGFVRELVKLVPSALDGPMPELYSDVFARALKFSSATEHAAWCHEMEWKTLTGGDDDGSV